MYKTICSYLIFVFTCFFLKFFLLQSDLHILNSLPQLFQIAAGALSLLLLSRFETLRRFAGEPLYCPVCEINLSSTVATGALSNNVYCPQGTSE